MAAGRGQRRVWHSGRPRSDVYPAAGAAGLVQVMLVSNRGPRLGNVLLLIGTDYTKVSRGGQIQAAPAGTFRDVVDDFVRLAQRIAARGAQGCFTRFRRFSAHSAAPRCFRVGGLRSGRSSLLGGIEEFPCSATWPARSVPAAHAAEKTGASRRSA